MGLKLFGVLYALQEIFLAHVQLLEGAGDRALLAQWAEALEVSISPLQVLGYIH